MATTRQGGAGIGLPPSFPVQGTFPLVTLGAGSISLKAGHTFALPAGQYMVSPGPYTFIQIKDPVLGIWRSLGTFPSQSRFVTSDGANVRLANLTGTVAGAYITNVGSAYTSAPTITPSAGGSTYTAVVGGAINTSVTVSAGGTGYLYAPQVVISPPPSGGVQATAICTISAGAVSTVTVINQGAGYTVAPTVAFVNEPRDTAGSGATATTALTGTGTITAILCTNQGVAVTAVPTLTFSGGGGSAAAATAVMCFTVTGISADTAGAGYGAAQPFGVLSIGGIVGGTAGAVVNPALDKSLFSPRQANVSGTSTGGGAITATGAVINDGGLFQAVPLALVVAGGSGLATTQGAASFTVGGVTDTSVILPY